jgi:hypothetical protein
MRKKMRIEIDTGSRLDQSGDTVFAFSNEIQKAVLLKQEVRDQCLQTLKGRRLSKELRLFAACVFLLIKDHLKKFTQIVIDEEYPGHAGELKRYLINLIKSHDDSNFPEGVLRIASIGKKSQAHKVAWRTWRKERRADQILRTQEILQLLIH